MVSISPLIWVRSAADRWPYGAVAEGRRDLHHAAVAMAAAVTVGGALTMALRTPKLEKKDAG